MHVCIYFESLSRFAISVSKNENTKKKHQKNIE